MYMLDTNMVRHVRYQNPRVMARLDAHRHETFVSGIVVEEIVILGFGAAMNTARSEKSPANIDRLYSDFLRAIEELAQFPTRSYTSEAEAIYRVLKSGKGSAKVKAMDGRIAAHALSLGAVLVTENGKDFAGVPGLTVDDWAR